MRPLLQQHIQLVLAGGVRRTTKSYSSASLTSAESDCAYGALATPRSVTIAVTNLAGVTSKAGFSTCTPAGVIALPAKCVTSDGFRCSIGILLPSGVSRSTVEIGAAT